MTEFRAPLLPRLVTGLLFVGVIVAILLTWLPLELPRSWGGLNQRRLISGGAALLLALPVMWWALVWQNLKVVVMPDRVEVRRGSRVRHSWDRRTTSFGSHVTQQRSYGMKTGATRELVARPAGGSPVRVLVPGLSRDKFNELYQLLAPLEVPGASGAPGAQGGDAGTARFASYGAGAPVAPPSPVVPPGMPPAYGPPSSAGQAPGVPVAYGPPPAGQPQAFGPPPTGAPVPMAPVPGVAGPTAPVPGATAPAGHGVWLPRSAWSGGRKAPERIDVAPGLLVVDGERIPFAALASIQLAPPTYPDWTLAVRANDGRTRRWRLGSPGADALTPQATYVGLIDALRSAAAGHPGLVSFDLG